MGERTPAGGRSAGEPAADAAGGSVEALLQRAGAGDQAAWDALVERYSPLVWSVTRALGLGRADAADVYQTTWLRLVEHLGRLREPERLGGWLAVTTRHEAFRALRRSGRVLPTDDEHAFDRPVEEGPADAILAAERDRDLWTAFAQVPARCQALLRLLVADPPVPYQAIGELLDLPVGSIGPTRSRCLDKLRAALAEVGGISGGGDGS